MSESEVPPDQMRLVLTPEQKEIVRRMSGQNIDAIELKPEDTKKGGGPTPLSVAPLHGERHPAPALGE